MSRILNAQTQAWLQVFVCAARHLSFTRCAEELHVTPGAISQQMRQLEERLGFKLFHRVARGLELTAEGQRLATTLNQAYGLIDAELRRLNAGQFGGVVRLRSIPSFLGKWLTPRLPRLQARFPDLQLRLVAEDSSWSLREGEFDLAIDLNDGSYPGLASTPLMDEEIFPVCAPSLLVGRPPLERPEDLEFYPLLHDITAWRGSYEYAEWEFYLASIGAPALDVRRGHTFNRNHLTIEAAIAGMGRRHRPPSPDHRRTGPGACWWCRPSAVRCRRKRDTCCSMPRAPWPIPACAPCTTGWCRRSTRWCWCSRPEGP